MSIRLFVFLFLISFGDVLAQKAVFITPKLGMLASTKGQSKILADDVENINNLPLSRVGEIRISIPSFGFEIGFQDSLNSFGLHFATTTILNGNRFTVDNKYSGRVERQLYLTFPRFETGLFYARENLLPINSPHRIQLSAVFTKNLSIYPEVYETNLGSTISGLPYIYARDSSIQSIQERFGFNFGISYQIPINTSKGKNIFDLRLEYVQGLRVVSRYYFEATTNDESKSVVRSDSRGSYFLIGLSRKINFKLR